FQAEDGAFGHDGDLLPALANAARQRISNVLRLRHELLELALLLDDALAVADLHLRTAAGERAGKDEGLRVVRDVGEAARAGRVPAELRDIDRAGRVDLGESECGERAAAAVDEIKVRGAIDDGLEVVVGRELPFAQQDAAVRTVLGGEM